MNPRPILSVSRLGASRSGLRRSVARVAAVALVGFGLATAGTFGSVASASPVGALASAAQAGAQVSAPTVLTAQTAAQTADVLSADGATVASTTSSSTTSTGGSALASVDTCGTAAQPIVCENQLTGTPESTWDDIDDSNDGGNQAGDPKLQGFSTNISVNVGDTESFKIDSQVSGYKMDIYRLGYYGGDGAALKVANVQVSNVDQPACLHDTTVHLTDCGNWSVSASWTVPANSVSGVYIARLTRTDNSSGDGSQIPFIVRNDASKSAVLFQTSDTTWEAYNNYGGDATYDGDKWFNTGANFYGGPSYTNSNRAYKISYNRPFITRGWEGGRDYLFANEYPMIRFMEENGYDVSYFSGVDTSRYGSLLENHKVFMTTGHDEYWDTVQRANVEKARDAGVNLAFFSGNDDYWKTRYEPSTDGSNTADRTLVSYKETWSNAKVDPTAEWTGTWRDPRFSPPADGDQPENSLGGTLFMSNITDDPVTVYKAQAQDRIWRNTGLSSMTAASTALAAHTVGYESNEDLDNGFRPAGLIDMSTMTDSVTAELKDFGTVTGPATTTHHITEYRAPSGALVFSAGTIQWAMGLDGDHDFQQTTADPRMQQATVNLFADMGAQPATLMTGLVATTRSTDTTAPVSTITSPASGATIANGTQVTVTGTATDVGGAVAGVEVSVDGGTTWHPVFSNTGYATWSYTAVLHGTGAIAIKSRATDDSANIETPKAGVTVNENCPCSLFGSMTPGTADSDDAAAVELGVKFTPTTDGVITGIRFYKAAANTGAHVGTLWSSTGTKLGTVNFTGESSSGWQTATFASPVSVSANTTYVASYTAPNGHYSADPLFFSQLDWNATGPVEVPRSTQAAPNGVYGSAGQFPGSSYQDENYYVDVNFTAATQVTPVVNTLSPTNGQVGVATGGTTVTGTFNVPVTGPVVAVKSASGSTVAGTTSFSSGTNTVSFTPSAALAASTTYTVTVSGAKSASGISMNPQSWTFTTDSLVSCPCSLFGTASVPTTPDSGDTTPVEIGTRFTPSANGSVTGIRFYKSAANTGTHIGTLWSGTGTALATGTFSGETASGWQTLTFPTPVSVTAGTTYTASYYAPVGHYAGDANFFTAPYTSGAVTAPATNNGVFAYTTTGGTTVPTTSFNATNYYVDALFTTGTVSPTVTATTPASAATDVNTATTVAASISQPITATGTTLTVKNAGGTAVTGSTAVSGSTVTFTPAATLAAGTTYTATVSATSTTGTAMASPYSWSFTTTGPVTCPCSLFPSTATPATLDSGDTSPVTLGVKFTPSEDGTIAGVKFYKSSTNTGTHIGALWSSTGTKLASGTFTGESASGWQTLTFSTPVSVTSGTTYVASYYDPAGHYSADSNYFATAYARGPLTAAATTNGVYYYGTSTSTMPASSYQASNYWVDVVFNDGAVTPAVSTTSPGTDDTSVPTSAAPTATFSTPVNSSSVSFTLKATSAGTAVAGTVAYASNKATFTPAAALAGGTQYTATVSATSTTGTAMPAPYSWSFTTASASACPCSLFGTSATPGTSDADDDNAVALGVQFSPATSGWITGVRFYKDASNTGTHTGTLWSSTGASLATGTFTGETAEGWQTLTFATPVAVTAGTSYTASYWAPGGHYSADSSFFVTPYTNGPLTATNGVFVYGSGTTAPTSTYQATNYWVDVNFTTTAPAGDTTAPTISAVAASGTGTTASVTWTTDESSTSGVAYGTSATALTSSATGTSGTAHTVALTGLTGGTTYYYRVTSADAAANSATSPVSTATAASFTEASTAGSATQTSLADFTAGTQSNTYVANRSGGEVTLKPTATTEFTGTAIPTGWAATSQATGSATTYSAAGASLSGTQLRTTATYASTRQLDAMATLKAVNGQWLGLTNSTSFSGTTNTWAAFRTTGTGGLVAEVHALQTTTDSAALSTSYLGSAHRFGVYWTSSQAVFTVDGTTVATVAKGTTVAMSAAAMDTTVDANPLALTSAWITPYAATGTLTSSVINAGATRTWGTFTPTSSLPAGTTITYQVRTGPNATAGSTGWSAWTAVAAGGTVGGSTQYLQYQALLSTTNTANAAPQLTQVVVAYS